MKRKQKRISGTIYCPTVTRYVDSNGKRVPKDTPGAKRIRKKSQTWRARYTDADGRTKTCSLFDDRETSEAKLADILQRERELRAGIRRHDPFEEHRTTPIVCPKCSGTGCTDAKGKATACESNHLDDFRRHLDTKGNTRRYVRMTVGRIREVSQYCGFDALDDLAGGLVSDCLNDRRQAGMSPSTSNAYLAAVKSFGNWLVRNRRLPENPFSHVSRVNQKVDVRVIRRALSENEVSRLINAAEAGSPYRGLSGPDRATLYLMAGFTGLRASELHSLTERSLDFRSEPPTVTLEAAYSKHRREDVLPLHPELAFRLQQWLQDRRPRGSDSDIIPLTERTSEQKPESAGPLFPGTWPERAAAMMRRDLKSARSRWIAEAESEAERADRENSDVLQPETSDGRADFHALRHTFITNLAASGVHPKLAKELARHSTITLTMDRYTHVGLIDMNAALESLPGVPQAADEGVPVVATGTDDSVVATMVATDECNHGSSQKSSTIASGSDDGRNVNRDDELRALLSAEESSGGGTRSGFRNRML